jgi:hypothetical protein
LGILNRFILLLMSLSFSYATHAQERDAGLWISGELQARINPKWELQGAGELRFRENFSLLGTAFVDIGTQFRFSEHWRVAGHYRYIIRRRSDATYGQRHRFYTDFTYQTNASSVEFSLRARIQHQQSESFSLLNAWSPENYMRSRLSLKWDAAWLLKPVGSFEVYHPLISYSLHEIDQFRAIAGIEYPISKWHVITFYFMFQSEVNVNAPDQDFVLGVEYRFAPRRLPTFLRDDD